jgi:hypothetical protein
MRRAEGREKTEYIVSFSHGDEYELQVGITISTIHSRGIGVKSLPLLRLLSHCWYAGFLSFMYTKMLVLS